MHPIRMNEDSTFECEIVTKAKRTMVKRRRNTYRLAWLGTWLAVWLLLPGFVRAGAEYPNPWDARFDSFAEVALKRASAPEGLAALHDAVRLHGKLSDDARLFELCQKLLKRKNLAPETRRLALWQFHRKAWMADDAEEVEKIQQKLGVVRHWRFVGPFDNEGGSGHDRAYPPEEEFDLSRDYAGKERPVRWRDFPDFPGDGRLRFKNVMTPVEQTTVYAQSWVKARKAMRAAVFFASSGAAKVWVNGRQVHEQATGRHWGELQDAFKISLKKGFNEILVKISSKNREPSFRLSLGDRRGRELRGVDVLNADDRSRFSARLVPRRPLKKAAGRPIALMHDKVLKTAGKGRDKDKALLAARLLRANRDFLPERKLDEEMLRLAMEAKRPKAEFYEVCVDIESDANRRRHCIEQWGDLEPDNPRPQLLLARELRKFRHDTEARNLLNQLVEIPQVAVEAELELARMDAGDNLPGRALTRVRRLHEALPTVVYLKNALLLRCRDLEMVAQTRELEDELLARDKRDTSLLSRLYRRWVQLERLDKAREVLDRILALKPYNTYSRQQKAELLQAADDDEGARATLQEGLTLFPESHELLESLGHLERGKGNVSEALRYFEKALAIVPQNPDLSRYVVWLSPQVPAFEEEFLVNAESWIAANPPIENDEEPSRRLLELNVYKVHANGLSSVFHQSLIRVNTFSAVERYRVQYESYSADRQMLTVQQARIFKPDGRVIERSAVHEQGMSERYKMFFDYRSTSIHFNELAPGDVIEIRYRLDDTARNNLFADYFGLLEPLRTKEPIAKAEVVVLAPREKKLFWNHPTQASEPSVEPRGEETLYRWLARDVPKVKEEPKMPGLFEIAPPLKVSTFEDWEAMGSWYWGLIEDQLDAGEELRRTAREAAQGAETTREKVLAVYDWVVRNTRYIGLEFGIHSYKPYQVNDIYQRKFGDCKDKASLMIAMLEELGVPAQMVVLRTSNLGAIEPYPPSLNMFNHAIAYIPELDLYLDGTAEFAGTGELHQFDRRGQAMVLDAESVRFVQIPPIEPEKNYVAQDMNVAWSGGEDVKMTGELALHGVLAPPLRRALQDTAQQRKTLERLFNRSFPGSELASFELHDLDDFERSPRLTFDISVPSMARKEGPHWVIPASSDSRFEKNLAPQSEREHPLVMAVPDNGRFRTLFTFPAGTKIVRLPENMKLDEVFGRFSFAVKSLPEGVEIRREVQFEQQVISPRDYPAFKRFCQEIDKATRQLIVLDSEGGEHVRANP